MVMLIRNVFVLIVGTLLGTFAAHVLVVVGITVLNLMHS
jgi:hypothetical protein